MHGKHDIKLLSHPVVYNVPAKQKQNASVTHLYFKNSITLYSHMIRFRHVYKTFKTQQFFKLLHCTSVRYTAVF
jgi:hypothetical protein